MCTAATSAVADLASLKKGQQALTMLLQFPSFFGSPAVRFNRWIRQFEIVVALSSWNKAEKIAMLTTKMTDKAYDILQNILDTQIADYEAIRRLLHSRFHGSENEDYYRKKFDKCDRRPNESVLDFGYRLQSIFQRAYPPQPNSSAADKAITLQFLRQKFLQGLGSDLRYKILYKNNFTDF